MNEEIKKIILEKLGNLFKEFEVLEKANTQQGDTFDVIATSEVIDRHGEVVKVEGVESKNWFRNPVILANHNYTIENIVGKGVELYEDKKGRLRLKGVFTQATEVGRIASELYKTGFLKAVSIGFLPKSRDEQDRDIITKWELLEVSFVAVPANPEALATGGKTMQKALELGLVKEETGISKEDLERIASYIKSDLLNDVLKGVEKIRDSIKAEIIEELKKDLSDDKDEDQDEKGQEEILKNFFQNLAKNVSNSLYQMKKGDK